MAAKGYWIGNITINDMDKVMEYRNANRETLNRYGANFIIMHGQQRILDPPVRPSWTVIEFPSYAAAVACREDPGYLAAAKIREEVNATEGIGAIVEGYDGTQDF